MTTTPNLIDITDLSDAVLDVILEARANPDGAVGLGHLSHAELRQLAQAMGWEPSARLSAWMAFRSEPAPKVERYGRDYEAAILAAQEDDYL